MSPDGQQFRACGTPIQHLDNKSRPEYSFSRTPAVVDCRAQRCLHPLQSFLSVLRPVSGAYHIHAPRTRQKLCSARLRQKTAHSRPHPNQRCRHQESQLRCSQTLSNTRLPSRLGHCHHHKVQPAYFAEALSRRKKVPIDQEVSTQRTTNVTQQTRLPPGHQ